MPNPTLDVWLCEECLLMGASNDPPAVAHTASKVLSKPKVLLAITRESDIPSTQWNCLLSLFSVLSESFFLQFGAELLIEAGTRRTGDSPEKCMPFIAFLGYGIMKLIAGSLSLLLFPHAFVRSSRFYGSSLVFAPIFTGLAMMGIGHLRQKRGEAVIRIDMFFYAYAFAFGMALIRLVYTKG